MKSRWGQLLTLAAVMVFSAGCVRTAGNNTFEPVTSGGDMTTPMSQPSATELPMETEAAPTEPPTIEANAQSENVTPTEGVAQVEPSATPIPALILTNTPTQAPTQVPPSATPIPVMPSATPLSVDAQAANPDSATTPTVAPVGSGPSGPVDIVTNTPIPSPTPVTPAADLQPTPTDMMGMGEDAETAAVEAGEGCVYTVVRGDNPFRIAVNNNITLAELQQANPTLVGINPVIQPGQELTIPGCGSGTAVATPEPTEEAVVEADATEEAAPAEAATEAPAPDGFIRYTVVSGDTLFKIATNYGTTVNAIVSANNIANPDSLAVGDELLIPDTADN